MTSNLKVRATQLLLLLPQDPGVVSQRTGNYDLGEASDAELSEDTVFERNFQVNFFRIASVTAYTNHHSPLHSLCVKQCSK